MKIVEEKQTHFEVTMSDGTVIKREKIEDVFHHLKNRITGNHSVILHYNKEVERLIKENDLLQRDYDEIVARMAK